MVRILKAFIVSSLLLFVLCGCKNLKEVDRITFPLVLGIDWNESNNNIKICTQISTLSTQPGGQSQSEAKFDIIESDGKTLKEAMDNLVDHAQQYISWKQLVAVVFTNKAAKRGIGEYLDVLIRNEQIRLNCYVILTPESLRDLLATSPIIETGLATTILGVSLISEDSPHIKAVTIKDIVLDILNHEKQPILPLLYIYRRQEEKMANKIELDYKGSGVFYNDLLVGELTEKETETLLFSLGIASQGSIDLYNFPDTKNGDISVSDIVTRTKFNPVMKNNKPEVTMDIIVKYSLYSYISNKELEADEIDRIDQAVAFHLKNAIVSLVKKAQVEYKSDIFGFGGKIYRKYPKYWLKNKQHWSDIFSHLNVNVNVKAELKDSGQLTDSLNYGLGKD